MRSCAYSALGHFMDFLYLLNYLTQISNLSRSWGNPSFVAFSASCSEPYCWILEKYNRVHHVDKSSGLSSKPSRMSLLSMRWSYKQGTLKISSDAFSSVLSVMFFLLQSSICDGTDIAISFVCRNHCVSEYPNPLRLYMCCWTVDILLRNHFECHSIEKRVSRVCVHNLVHERATMSVISLIYKMSQPASRRFRWQLFCTARHEEFFMLVSLMLGARAFTS